MILKDRVDQSLFELNDSQWQAVKAGIIHSVGIESGDLDLHFNRFLGARLLHDLKITQRSPLNYATCLLAFDDAAVSGEKGAQALLRALNVNLSNSALCEQIELVRVQHSQLIRIHNKDPLFKHTSGAKVLLVDDHPEPWSNLLQEALDCQVDTIKSDWAETIPGLDTYDLVILDLYLDEAATPRGLDLLKRLGSVDCTVPVVIFTSSEAYKWAQEARREKQLIGFVNKNFETLRDCSNYIDFRTAVIGALEHTRGSSFLRDSLVVEQIDTLARRWSSYTYSSVSSESISAYLRQFRTKGNMLLALKLLRHIQFFSRQAISATMQEMISKATDDVSRCILVHFGGLYDSSKVLCYLYGDFVQDDSYRYLALANSLSDALQMVRDSGGRITTILFADDFLGTGNQAEQIYSEWLGRTPERTVDKQHVQPLSVEDRLLLKKLSITHLYLVACFEGIQRLESFWRGLDFRDVRIEAGILTRLRDSCFNTASCIFDTPEENLRAKRLFERIGNDLMQTQGGLSASESAGKALGYGNCGKLFVYFYNVPTVTITALWQSGRHGGRKWEPLFRRRTKR